MTRSSDFLKEVKEDPKHQVLHTLKGKKALNAMKQVLFKEDPESKEAMKWAGIWNEKEVRAALLIVYSRLLRKNKVIIITLIIGDDAVLGEKLTYEKGMDMMAKFENI